MLLQHISQLQFWEKNTLLQRQLNNCNTSIKLKKWKNLRIISQLLTVLKQFRILIAVCNFAFRFGMETTAYEGPIVAPVDYEGNLLVFEKGNDCSIRLEEKEQFTIVHITGEGQELENFWNFLCENFPLLTQQKNFRKSNFIIIRK